jgi:hypothetical protein
MALSASRRQPLTLDAALGKTRQQPLSSDAAPGELRQHWLAFDAVLGEASPRQLAQRYDSPPEAPRKGGDDDRPPKASSRAKDSTENAQATRATHSSLSTAITQLVAEEVRARLLSLISAPSAPKPTHTASPNYTKRRQVGDDLGIGATPCLEIVLAQGGTRIVISRENQVWLLSIQTETPLTPAQTKELTEMLRAQFAQHGLGPVDIVA